MDKKILVIGCGSIGKRHIQNLLSLGVGRVFVYDTDKDKLAKTCKELPVESLASLDDLAGGRDYDAALICSPPSFHISHALALIQKGIHCFIEKPLSHTLENIDTLIELAKKKKKTVLVGYNLRFSPLLVRIKKILDDDGIGKPLSLRASVGYYLPYWRPKEDYRIGYGAKASLGGGIVFDANHEIDYARYFLGEVKEVFATCQKLSNLDIDTEDFAEITMQHKNGSYSQVHLDYLQTSYRRSCEIIGEKGMLVWDINNRVLEQYGMNDREYQVYYEGLNANVNDLYLEEIGHFFRCIDGTEKPVVGLDEGKRVQEITMKIKESSNEKRILPV